MPRLMLITEEQGHGGIHTVLQQLQASLHTQGWQVQKLAVRPMRAGQVWRGWRMARQADVLLASNNFRPAYLTVLLAALSRRPAVVWVHGPLQAVLGSERPRTFKQRALCWLYRRTQLVCVSHTTRESLQAWMGAPNAQVPVIHNPAPPCSRFETPPQDDAQPFTDLGFVGRLSAEKRPEWLLEVLRQLPPHFRLSVVGDGPLLKTLQAQGADLARAGRLRWLGAMPVERHTYQRWQLTLLCSAYEGYPMVALESMAAGVPCVGTPLPALREMLGPHADHWLASEDSPSALANKVLRVLESPGAERSKLAHAVAAEHDTERFGLAWHALLMAQARTQARDREGGQAS